jgi:bifunctional non-homologous end joining protein LigD
MAPTREEVLEVAGREVRVTNPGKVFFPRTRHTKLDLVRYYLAVAEGALRGVSGRPMALKRYPNGAEGEFFFQKRAPTSRPEWIETVELSFPSGRTAHEIVVSDPAQLAWIINLGCIDLNPWYARCDDVSRPDFLHFDLDPTPGATLAQIVEVAHRVRDALAELGLAAHVKTTGSRGLHVYVAIGRGPTQKQVWALAKALALELARRHPGLVTAEYRVARRPTKHVVVDYNQNAWGRTLASVYSVRPTPRATVSAPLEWTELTPALRMEDYRIDTVPARIRERGDLWKPMLATRRHDITPLLEPAERWLKQAGTAGPRGAGARGRRPSRVSTRRPP